MAKDIFKAQRRSCVACFTSAASRRFLGGTVPPVPRGDSRMNRVLFCSRLLSGITLTAFFLMASTARASLVSAMDGGVAVTVDTGSGLEWLDASNTLGQVVSTAQADFPQFQLATESQIETLLVDAGYPAGQLPNGSTSDSTAGNLLASTLGYSLNYWVQFYGPGASGWEYQSFAYYLDSAGTGVDQVDLDVRNPPLGNDGTYTNFYALGDSFSTGSSNNFVMLVKVVPEPGTAILLSLGVILVGLGRGGLRRRK